jgi:hypothetical protein
VEGSRKAERLTIERETRFVAARAGASDANDPRLPEKLVLAHRSRGPSPREPKEQSDRFEREKGFEPSTSTLARLHSTTELLPHGRLTF